MVNQLNVTPGGAQIHSIETVMKEGVDTGVKRITVTKNGREYTVRLKTSLSPAQINTDTVFHGRMDKMIGQHQAIKESYAGSIGDKKITILNKQSGETRVIVNYQREVVKSPAESHLAGQQKSYTLSERKTELEDKLSDPNLTDPAEGARLTKKLEAIKTAIKIGGAATPQLAVNQAQIDQSLTPQQQNELRQIKEIHHKFYEPPAGANVREQVRRILTDKLPGDSLVYFDEGQLCVGFLQNGNLVPQPLPNPNDPDKSLYTQIQEYRDELFLPPQQPPPGTVPLQQPPPGTVPLQQPPPGTVPLQQQTPPGPPPPVPQRRPLNPEQISQELAKLNPDAPNSRKGNDINHAVYSLLAKGESLQPMQPMTIDNFRNDPNSRTSELRDYKFYQSSTHPNKVGIAMRFNDAMVIHYFQPRGFTPSLEQQVANEVKDVIQSLRPPPIPQRPPKQPQPQPYGPNVNPGSMPYSQPPNYNAPGQPQSFNPGGVVPPPAPPPGVNMGQPFQPNAAGAGASNAQTATTTPGQGPNVSAPHGAVAIPVPLTNLQQPPANQNIPARPVNNEVQARMALFGADPFFDEISKDEFKALVSNDTTVRVSDRAFWSDANNLNILYKLSNGQSVKTQIPLPSSGTTEQILQEDLQRYQPIVQPAPPPPSGQFGGQPPNVVPGMSNFAQVAPNAGQLSPNSPAPPPAFKQPGGAPVSPGFLGPNPNAAVPRPIVTPAPPPNTAATQAKQSQTPPTSGRLPSDNLKQIKEELPIFPNTPVDINNAVMNLFPFDFNEAKNRGSDFSETRPKELKLDITNFKNKNVDYCSYWMEGNQLQVLFGIKDSNEFVKTTIDIVDPKADDATKASLIKERLNLLKNPPPIPQRPPYTPPILPNAPTHDPRTVSASHTGSVTPPSLSSAPIAGSPLAKQTQTQTPLTGERTPSGPPPISPRPSSYQPRTSAMPPPAPPPGGFGAQMPPAGGRNAPAGRSLPLGSPAAKSPSTQPPPPLPRPSSYQPRTSAMPPPSPPPGGFGAQMPPAGGRNAPAGDSVPLGSPAAKSPSTQPAAAGLGGAVTPPKTADVRTTASPSRTPSPQRTTAVQADAVTSSTRRATAATVNPFISLLKGYSVVSADKKSAYRSIIGGKPRQKNEPRSEYENYDSFKQICDTESASVTEYRIYPDSKDPSKLKMLLSAPARGGHLLHEVDFVPKPGMDANQQISEFITNFNTKLKEEPPPPPPRVAVAEVQVPPQSLSVEPQPAELRSAQPIQLNAQREFRTAKTPSPQPAAVGQRETSVETDPKKVVVELCGKGNAEELSKFLQKQGNDRREICDAVMRTDNLAFIKLYLSTKEGRADIDSAEYSYDARPLAYAVANGKEAIVDLLIEHGAIVDDTAIRKAARNPPLQGKLRNVQNQQKAAAMAQAGAASKTQTKAAAPSPQKTSPDLRAAPSSSTVGTAPAAARPLTATAYLKNLPENIKSNNKQAATVSLTGGVAPKPSEIRKEVDYNIFKAAGGSVSNFKIYADPNDSSKLKMLLVAQKGNETLFHEVDIVPKPGIEPEQQIVDILSDFNPQLKMQSMTSPLQNKNCSCSSCS